MQIHTLVSQLGIVSRGSPWRLHSLDLQMPSLVESWNPSDPIKRERGGERCRWRRRLYISSISAAMCSSIASTAMMSGEICCSLRLPPIWSIGAMLLLFCSFYSEIWGFGNVKMRNFARILDFYVMSSTGKLGCFSMWFILCFDRYN